MFVILLSHTLGHSHAGNAANDSLRLLACALGVASVAALARWICLAAGSRLEADFHDRAPILNRFGRTVSLHSLYSLLVYAIVLHGCGWSDLVLDRWQWRGWFAVDRLLLLAPYLAGDFLSAVSFHQFDRLLRTKCSGVGMAVQTRIPLGEFLEYRFRSEFALLLFLSLFAALMNDIAKAAAPQAMKNIEIATLYWWVVALVLIVVMPNVIKYVFRARPLIHGPLRDRLELLATKLGLRYADILVWNTDGMMANAYMSGLIGRWRYVMISDVIVDQFSTEELQAVFGHEIGHIRHRHLHFHLLFLVLSILLMTLLGKRLEPNLLAAIPEQWRSTLEVAWAIVPLDVMLLAPYIALVFGWWSRCCERQADVFSCRAVSLALLDRPPSMSTLGSRVEASPAPAPETRPKDAPLAVIPEGAWLVIHALEKTASLNRLPKTRWLWLHGSIADRIDFLERVSRDPLLADRLDRFNYRLRWRIAIGLVGGIVTLWLWK